MSAFLSDLARLRAALDSSGLSELLWPALLLGSIVAGIRQVRRHMARNRILIEGQVVGARTDTDTAGATVWRSAASVQRRPSLSPFWGRPAWLRGLPYPVATAYAALWWYQPAVAALLTVAVVAWGLRRGVRWNARRQHYRGIVVPMTKALGPAIGEVPSRILQGIVVPADYEREDAEIVIPLPDDHRPSHIAEASRIVTERLGGEWRSVRSGSSPYLLTLSHKPAPPRHVEYADVADLLLAGDVWTPFLGLGTESEKVRINFNGDVVHLGISAGTGAGKSNVMRLLATQFAIHGVPAQVAIDVKGDIEGMDQIPGMRVLNDIGDLDNLDGLPRMWAAIRAVCSEMDARRRGLRGPKDSWDPIVMWLDEQNMFADYTQTAWDMLREKDDPKVAPVWGDLRNIGFMGRSFKIRMVNAYQVMSAAAMGGGNAAKGGEFRRQFGNKLLARFDGPMWDNLVGTRPRGQSSDIPGRWLLVNNAGVARAVQVPLFEPHHVAELVAYAGMGMEVPAAVPGQSPQGAMGTSHEIPVLLGGQGTGDTPPAPRNVIPIRGRVESSRSDARRTAPEKRYTLEAACAEGIIPMSYDAAKRARTRARQTGAGFPEGIREGRAETYRPDDLREWYGNQYGERGAQ